jgi:acylpyruvate hydrolase
LQTGDVILTGTPSGVGQVKPGDKVECRLEDNSTGTELAKIEFEAVEREGKYQFKP